ncbi:MAG: PIN domain-containing protein [Chloroflexota bacterium]|nr:PIN domain-containing protein [Chloroflexota bacterium]
MRRIFADSSVVISGSVSRTGASRAILSMAEIGLFQLVVSHQVLDECERNLRKKSPAALPYFAQLLASINLAIVEDPTPEDSLRWLVYIEINDAPILAAAVAAGVDRLLTLNTKHFTPQVAQASGLHIQIPGEFVQEIRTIVTQGLP